MIARTERIPCGAHLVRCFVVPAHEEDDTVFVCNMSDEIQRFYEMLATLFKIYDNLIEATTIHER